MSIVDAGHGNMTTISFYHDMLVQQHPDPHPFEIRYHQDCVVIPEDSVNVTAENLPQGQHTQETGMKRAEGQSTIVSRQNAKIVTQAADEPRRLGHGAGA